MRYRKGHVAISDTRDVPVLLVVRNARAATMSQLIDELFHSGLEKSYKSIYWRLRRLVTNGFLAQLRLSKTIGEPVYALTRTGLGALEYRGYYLLALNSETKSLLADAEVVHMIEVNAVRIALMKAGVLENWKTELEIVSENLVNRFHTRKDFDAIATVRHGERRIRFALEFERTAKSSARYHEISKLILQDPSIDLVLYSAANEEVMSVLAHEFQSLGDKVVICLLNQFKTRLLQTPVLTMGDHCEFYPFAEILDERPEAADNAWYYPFEIFSAAKSL
jgi:hypothetical protein